MTDIGFYHLERTPVETALPRLLEKALQSGMRVLVRVPTAAAVGPLNMALWTYDTTSFLPHGGFGDGLPQDQPIYLTAEDERPNGADLLAQVGGAEYGDLGPFKRCLDLFEGGDEAAVAAARARWRRYQAAGHTLAYWQQTPQGGWVRKA